MLGANCGLSSRITNKVDQHLRATGWPLSVLYGTLLGPSLYLSLCRI